MEDRIIAIEKKISFQEYSLIELNEVLLEQQQLIKKLHQEIKDLKERVSEEDIVKKLDDEVPPPHY